MAARAGEHARCDQRSTLKLKDILAAIDGGNNSMFDFLIDVRTEAIARAQAKEEARRAHNACNEGSSSFSDETESDMVQHFMSSDSD